MPVRVRGFDVTDVHIGAEVHRIVLGGVSPPPGETLRDQANYLEQHADALRTLLLHEPRGGQPSLSADLVVAPRHPEADAGVIIMEFMGYPLFSGSNAMATAIALLEAGRVDKREGEQRVRLESPGGLMDVFVEVRGGRVASVTYESSSPSFIESSGVVEVPDYGAVHYDMVWSGVFYAVIDAQAHGLSLSREHERALLDFAAAFVDAAHPTVRPVHPTLGDVGPLSFALLAGRLSTAGDGIPEQRIASYVHPNSLCRCPSGTGTAAAMTQRLVLGELSADQPLRAVSWFDTTFYGEVRATTEVDGQPGYIVAARGYGGSIARTRVIVDLDDPVNPGPGLEQLLPDPA